LCAVGGIYQVIRSKCGASVEELGDQYILLGPYKEATAQTEVEITDFGADSPLQGPCEKLRSFGWKVRECGSDVNSQKYLWAILS
jgi:glycogen(starch) synthase